MILSWGHELPAQDMELSWFNAFVFQHGAVTGCRHKNLFYSACSHAGVDFVHLKALKLWAWHKHRYQSHSFHWWIRTASGSSQSKAWMGRGRLTVHLRSVHGEAWTQCSWLGAAICTQSCDVGYWLLCRWQRSGHSSGGRRTAMQRDVRGSSHAGKRAGSLNSMQRILSSAEAV